MAFVKCPGDVRSNNALSGSGECTIFLTARSEHYLYVPRHEEVDADSAQYASLSYEAESRRIKLELFPVYKNGSVRVSKASQNCLRIRLPKSLVSLCDDKFLLGRKRMYMPGDHIMIHLGLNQPHTAALAGAEGAE